MNVLGHFKWCFHGFAAKINGSRGIFESIMTDIMYELPSRPEVDKCIITADVVNGVAEPVLILRGEAKGSEQLHKEKEA